LEVFLSILREPDDLLCSCTRGFQRPSHGLMARLGVPLGGLGEKVARSRRSISPIPDETTSKLGRII
jgi:hypothetical protein